MSDTKVHRTDIQVRFGDTDALGHVNNASFAAYAELARLDFFPSRSLILTLFFARQRRPPPVSTFSNCSADR